MWCGESFKAKHFLSSANSENLETENNMSIVSIISVEGATTLIADGQEITVDGAAGTVTLGQRS